MIPALAAAPLPQVVAAGLALAATAVLAASPADPPVPAKGTVAVTSPAQPAAAPTSAAQSQAPSSTATWRLPLAGPPHVLRPFDPPSRAWLPGHRGVDLAAPPGALVRAAGSGTITWAGLLVDRGVVVVTHADGLRTTYEPVDATVAVGDRVALGDVIATIGAGDVHCGSLPTCLHWGLRRGRDYLDPMLLVDPGHAVLLPP